jgi:hypothetical protein
MTQRLLAILLALSLLALSHLAACAQDAGSPLQNALAPSSDATPPSPVVSPAPQSPPPAPPPAAPDTWGSSADWGDWGSQAGRGGFAGYFGAAIGQMPIRTDYRVTWLPSEPVKGQPTDLGFVRQDFSWNSPIWQNGNNEWSASIHLSNELLQTDAVLPLTGQPLPEDLWGVRFGTTFRHLFDNGWIAGVTLSVGSASDKPFNSIQEMTAGINAFLRVPQGENNAWLFTISYSSNSELPFPIPGVAFVLQPTDAFRMTLGLPFQIMYRPCSDLTFDFSYMPITAVHSRITYRVIPRVRIYAAYDYNNEIYLPADRPDDADRLFYYEQRVSLGVQVAMCRNATFELASGYAFDRYFFEGQSYSDRSTNRIDVGNGPFLSADLRVRW